SATNTYTGLTTLTAGIIDLQNSAGLGTTAGATTMATGTQIQIDGNALSIGENITINSTGISNDGAIRNLANNNTLTGTITLGSASRISSDAGTLTKSGANNIT